MLIYKITNKITNKSYVGFTSKSIKERFHKHYLNAMSGMDTYLYKSIRKYGIDKFSIVEIEKLDNQNEAYEREKYYIEKYTTISPSGYNLTKGGDGGWIIGALSQERQNEYYIKRQELTHFDKNPNFSGFSDLELIDIAADFFKNIGYIGGQRVWQKIAKLRGLPQTFSKNRFNGSYMVFANILVKKTGLPFIKHKKSDAHKNKLRESSKSNMWVTNGITTKMIKKIEYENYKTKGYTQGRKL